MIQHQRSHHRFLPTYATLVGLPALALLLLLGVGDAVAGKNAVTNAAGSPMASAASHAAASGPSLRTMLVFSTLTIMPIHRVSRWLLRLVGRGQS